MSYQIITDSCSDLDIGFLKENNVAFVSFHVTYDSQNYFRDMVDQTKDEFYDTLRNQLVYPKTSMPSIQDYVDAFKPSLKDGKDILCFCLSHKLSGSYNSAVNAVNVLKEDYPDRNILIMDTYSATAGEGLFVHEAIQMRDAGIGIEKAYDTLQKLLPTCLIHFTVSNLEYLQRGGRLGKAGALIGSVLNIKPIMHIQNGELIPVSKVRGLKKAYQEITQLALSNMRQSPENYNFCTLYNDTTEDALQIQKQIEETLGISACMPPVYVGTTIGAHTGPGAIGVAYIQKYDTV